MSLGLNCTLGGVSLPDGMYWANQHDLLPYGQGIRRAINGGIDVLTATITGGQPITLVAELPRCRLLETTHITPLRALLATPADTLTLSWNSTSYSVIFDNPPLAISNTFLRDSETGQFWFTGSINLLTV